MQIDKKANLFMFDELATMAQLSHQSKKDATRLTSHVLKTESLLHWYLFDICFPKTLVNDLYKVLVGIMKIK